MTSRKHARSKVTTQMNMAIDSEELVLLKRRRPPVASSGSLGQYLATSHKAYAPRHATKGLVTLKEMAVKYLALNIRHVACEALSQCDWLQAGLIWEALEVGMLDSLESFVKFASAFPQDFQTHKTLHVSTMDLLDTLDRVTRLSLVTLNDARDMEISRPLPWTLQLDFSHIHLAQDILIQLGTLPGLSALRINDASICDDIITHWSRAQAAGGFSQLRLLDIRCNRIKRLWNAITVFSRFSGLEFLRCDALPLGEVYASAAVPEVDFDSEFQKCRGPVLTVKTHMGSRADNRPTQPPRDDMVLHIPTLRQSMSTVKNSSRVPRNGSSVHMMMGKKQKKLRGYDDIWEQVLL